MDNQMTCTKCGKAKEIENFKPLKPKCYSCLTPNKKTVEVDRKQQIEQEITKCKNKLKTLEEELKFLDTLNNVS